MSFRRSAVLAPLAACFVLTTSGGASARSSHPRAAHVVQALGAPASSAPIVPPADWLPVDTTSLDVANIRVFAAWRINLVRPDIFTQNINVGVQNFTGDLDEYDRASIASIHAMASDARILLHEKTTICSGIPAYHTIFTALALMKPAPIELHYEQIYIAADQQKFVATYTRAAAQPDVDEARNSIRTLCNPIAPAGSAT